MHKFFYLLILFITAVVSQAQPNADITLKVVDQQGTALSNTTIELLNQKDSSLLKALMTDTAGMAVFKNLLPGKYFWKISRVGYATHFTHTIPVSGNDPLNVPFIVLQPSNSQLNNITVLARKPFIELKPGKTIVNLESSATAIGATALEALEKLPGIAIDKDGNISLKGKTGVMIMMDGKPSYLDATQLSTLLNGISASQISQVEIMDQPSARYDAAGNAGIINIKMKKNAQKGFNGSISASYAQGRYPKANNNLQLNYRSGQWNFFLNYSVNFNRSFTRIYALRTYFKEDGAPSSFLEQPSFLSGTGHTHVLRTGVDYTINSKTSMGLTLNGLSLSRDNTGNNLALWMAPDKSTDSLIETNGHNTNNWKTGGATLNFKHAFTASRELTADIDLVGYRIRGDQVLRTSLSCQLIIQKHREPIFHPIFRSSQPKQTIQSNGKK